MVLNVFLKKNVGFYFICIKLINILNTACIILRAMILLKLQIKYLFIGIWVIKLKTRGKSNYVWLHSTKGKSNQQLVKVSRRQKLSERCKISSKSCQNRKLSKLGLPHDKQTHLQKNSTL